MKTKLQPIRIVLAVIAFLVMLLFCFFGAIFAAEYKPGEADPVTLDGVGTQSLKLGDTIKLTSWNIGYAGLGEKSDFFMDGGKNVVTGDFDYVEENLSGIEEYLINQDSDIFFLQEVDKQSARTYNYDQQWRLQDSLPEYQGSFAYNFRVFYVPYPLPPIGRVNSGLLTLNKYESASARRLGLPNPFSWPVRAVNLKRCLLENRIPIEGTDKELVIYNLHLEAYDNGEGKKAQTERLSAILSGETKKGNYVIAGGDFNQVFSNVDTSKYPSIAYDLWKPGDIDINSFRKGFNFLMDDSEPSCRSLDRPYNSANDEFQFYVIDGFIVSDNITVNEISTDNLDFKNSDHNPVNLSVTIK